MNSTIIKIGNSKGIRIPKPLLMESGIDTYVNIVVKKGEIRITPAPTPKNDNNLNTALSEPALAKDWLNKEEDEAWKNL